MFDYVTYRSWKTTTITPANYISTIEIGSAWQSESRLNTYTSTGQGVRLNTNVSPPRTEIVQMSDNVGQTITASGNTQWTVSQGFASSIQTETRLKQVAGNLTWYGESDSYSFGYTTFSSRSQNSWTQSSTNTGVSWATSGSTTGSFSKQKVTKETTTQSTYTASLRTTGSSSLFTWIYTTTIPEGQTLATTSGITSSVSGITDSSTQTTFSRTQTTTSGTEEFLTYSEWSVHQIVVADTIVLTVSAERTGAGSLAVLQTQTGTEFSAINNLPYLTQNTTISWLPPLTTSTLSTTEAFTTSSGGIQTPYGFVSASSWENSGQQNDVPWTGRTWRITGLGDTVQFRGASSTTETEQRSTTIETISTRNWLTAEHVTFTCEDWVTYTTASTTTNTSTSGTISITSFSLNTGYTWEEQDDEGNWVVRTERPEGYSWQTSLTTYEQWTTTQTNTTVTNTLWEDSYPLTQTLNPRLGSWQGGIKITTPEVKLSTEKLGIGIETNQLPWKTQNSWNVIQVSFLDSSTSISSTQTIAGRATTFYSTAQVTQNGQSGSGTRSFSYEEGDNKGRNGDTSEFVQDYQRTISYTSTGTVFETENNNSTFGDAFFYGDRAWATQGSLNYAADDDYQYNTNPTRTGAALIFTMQGNQHTIPIGYEDLYSLTASVVPSEIEPLIYPTYSAVLNQNDCGFGAHPSVWSTITLSRVGKSISSTWQYQTNGSNGTVYTTGSGTCGISTQSAFPYGVRGIDTAVIGGHMQPNKKIVFFQEPGVFLTITADTQATASGFQTVSSWGTEQISASNITVRRAIPRVAGVGYYRFSILDNGMP